MNDFADLDGLIWMDGELVPWREAKVHLFTHTLHYGMGFFEGIRVYQTDKGGVVFRLQEHVDRFFDNAKIINISMPISKEVFTEALFTVLRENKLTAAYVRPIGFLGTEKWGVTLKGLTLHVAIAALPWVGYRDHDRLVQQGLQVMTSSIQRNHINSVFAKAKISGHYVNSLLAAQEASNCGYDEPLMLDHQGFITEGCGANFFMVKDGVVYTPHAATIFAGITRATTIELCRDLNIPVVECNIVREQIYLADEAFFTGTAYEIMPMRSLDKREIGSAKPGPITQKIQHLYTEITHGHHRKYRKWLSYV